MCCLRESCWVVLRVESDDFLGLDWWLTGCWYALRLGCMGRQNWWLTRIHHRSSDVSPSGAAAGKSPLSRSFYSSVQ